jgi:hypothetical protein
VAERDKEEDLLMAEPSNREMSDEQLWAMAPQDVFARDAALAQSHR